MSKNYQSPYLYFVGFAAALAGLLFGFDTGVISGAIIFVKLQYHLPAEMVGFVVSAVLVGAVCGTVVSNYLSRNYGRRSALLAAGVLFCVGAIGSGVAPDPDFLIASRFFLGIAIGIASYTAPLYLAEISPKNVRGRIIALYQFMITIGLLTSFISDMLFTSSGQWRWMLAMPLIPAAIMLLAVIFLPRSPRWLILNNRNGEARIILKKIFPSTFSFSKVDSIVAEISEQIRQDKEKNLGWRAIKNSRFRAVLIVGILAQIMQQWSGINAVMYYAPSILKTVGFSTPMQEMWGTILIGVVNVLTTIVTLKYVDKWGRRPILFGGLVVMILSLILLGTVATGAEHSVALQFLALFSVLIYIIGFAVSLGPVVWILCSEIYPTTARDFGIMFSTAANWLSNALLAMVFPSFMIWFADKTFFIFAGLCVLGIGFVKYFVPETKGVTLEQIEANLMMGKRVRNIGKTVVLDPFGKDLTVCENLTDSDV